MKKHNYKLLLLILLIVCRSNWAQQDSTAQSTKDLWNTVYDYTADLMNNKGMSKKLSDADISIYAKKYYTAISEDPVGFQKYFLNEHNKWGDSIKKGYNVRLRKPAALLGVIEKKISEKYGPGFVKIIGVPYYLKVKIIKDSISSYTPPNLPDMHALQINLICTVEEIIKGEKFFKIGQNINILYLINWTLRDGVNNIAPNGNQEFIEGKSYFIPVKVWGMYINFSQLAVNVFPDTYFPIYPVDNGIISTPGDFFGTGETCSWDTFKTKFSKKYILK